MSVIVAYKERDKIIVACDDRETVKNLYKYSYSRKSKAFVYYGKKEFIIGCAGNVAIADILAPKIGQLSKIDETTLYDVILDFQDKYRNTPFIDSEDCLDGQLIVACNDRAYLISSNLVIIEITDYDAIGSGTEPALAVLTATRHLDLKPITRVYLAVKTAGELINTVSENVYITDTKELRFSKRTL